jgi:predicted nucleic acid-binding protein
MKFVVDASVAVKWFADEPLFDKARELQRHSLAAPDLIFAEVANVMWKLWRKGVLTDAHHAARGEALKDAPLAVTPVRDLLASAMRLARELDHPVYDCFYLALAVREGYPVITADQRFAGAAAGHPYLSKFIQKL